MVMLQFVPDIFLDNRYWEDGTQVLQVGHPLLKNVRISTYCAHRNHDSKI